MLRQPTSGKEMVITSSTATFLRRRRWGEEPANLWVDGLNLCCRARGLPCLCPILFFYFFSFFASKRIITFFQNMSFNDLSSRIFFRTLSSFNGIFPSIFTSLLFYVEIQILRVHRRFRDLAGSPVGQHPIPLIVLKHVRV